jgi:hypothetical protein
MAIRFEGMDGGYQTPHFPAPRGDQVLSTSARLFINADAAGESRWIRLITATCIQILGSMPSKLFDQ